MSWQAVRDWWTRLWDSSEFMPRSHCGVGMTSDLIARSIQADNQIFYSYLCIPAILVAAILWRHFHHHDVSPWLWLYGVMCTGFIVSCGVTHRFDVLMFTEPSYRAFVLVKETCALLSIATVLGMPPAVMSLINRPTLEQYRKLQKEYSELRVLVERLDEDG